MNKALITGAAGFIGRALCSQWLGLWIAYFLAVYRKFHQPSPHTPPQWILCGSAAAVLSFLIAGLFETNFYDSEVVMVLYFIMALPFVSSNNSQSAPSESAAPLHSGGDLHGRNPAQRS